MRTPLYNRIRRFTFTAVLTLLVLVGGAIFVVVWEVYQISQVLQQSVSYHLATVQSTSSATKALQKLEVDLLEQLIGPESGAEVIQDDPPLLPAERLHTKRHLYTIETALDSIIGSQNAFQDTKFERTLEKIKKELAELTNRSDAVLLQKGVLHISNILQATRSLDLSFNQLERLHLIAYSEANHQIESNISRRNLIVIPAALAVLICGLVVMRYLLLQTRRALLRVEKSDQALQRLNSELEARVNQRTAELHNIQEVLLRKERLAALGQLTGSVSHELRNPLGAIRTSLATIKRSGRETSTLIKSSIEIADRSIVRCEKVIQELLDYTRLRSLDMQTTAFDDWLESLLDEYQFPAGIQLRRDLASNAQFTFDQESLHRAMFNLLDNACQAMAEERKSCGKTHILIVATRLFGERLELSITDTGSGVAPEDLRKIFEPLYSTKSFGIGLGLPIVKQIIEQQGGKIEITSEPGHGTKALLHFPLRATEQRVAS